MRLVVVCICKHNFYPAAELFFFICLISNRSYFQWKRFFSLQQEKNVHFCASISTHHYDWQTDMGRGFICKIILQYVRCAVFRNMVHLLCIIIMLVYVVCSDVYIYVYVRVDYKSKQNRANTRNNNSNGVVSYTR